MPKIDQPTNEEWNSLYMVAQDFKKFACWEWMYDNDIFGVQDPESGEIAYCCIMGNAGEHFAIAGYLEAEGLDGILKLLSGEIDPSDPDNMYLQKCLMCSLEDRAVLTPEDFKVIKDLGLKFRGRNAWPVFRHHKPGLFPWFLTGQQCRFLTHIITQALDVSSRCIKDKQILEHRTLYSYLIRSAKKDKTGELVWEDQYKEIEPYSPAFVSFNIRDEMRVRRLASIKPDSRLVFEVDTFFTPSPIKEKGRPYYPKVCMLLDHGSSMIISFEMLSNLKKEGHRCIEMLAGFIEKNGVKPSRLLVARDETYYLYIDVCRQLGIKLEKVKYLKLVEQMRSEMFNFMLR